MDKTGFDTMWLAEHHFQREGYECIPNILMLAVHLAHLTERIDFGCGFNVTPMWHPLRLAEDFATADILTGGRVVFGVGRGYHTREVEVFGAPMLDTDANRALFEEQVEVIMAALKERSFSHHGKHYDIPPRVPYRGYELEDITLVPKPLRRPLECWQPIVSASPRGLDFMVKHGMKGVIGGGAAPGGANAQAIAAWQDALARSGRDAELGEDLLITFSTHVAETPEEGDGGGQALLRGAHEDVRASRVRPGAERRADRGAGRPREGGRRVTADHRRRRRRRLVACRPAGEDRRAAPGDPGAPAGPRRRSTWGRWSARRRASRWSSSTRWGGRCSRRSSGVQVWKRPPNRRSNEDANPLDPACGYPCVTPLAGSKRGGRASISWLGTPPLDSRLRGNDVMHARVSRRGNDGESTVS